MAGVLVNINARCPELSYQHNGHCTANLVACLQSTPIPEYQQLVNAWSEFWYELGSKKVCGECFAKDPAHRACCSDCTNLSTTGCVAKPLYCAMFACGRLHDLVPNGFHRQFAKLESEIGNWYFTTTEKHGFAGSPFYSTGYLKDVQHPWTKKDRATLTSFTRRVKLLLHSIQRTRHAQSVEHRAA